MSLLSISKQRHICRCLRSKANTFSFQEKDINRRVLSIASLDFQTRYREFELFLKDPPKPRNLKLQIANASCAQFKQMFYYGRLTGLAMERQIERIQSFGSDVQMCHTNQAFQKNRLGKDGS